MMTDVGLEPPTVIIANARIATGDPARPWATAIAVHEETLAAIGSAAEILKLAGPSTRVVDAGGRTLVLPGQLVVGGGVRIMFRADGDFALQFSVER